MAAGPACCPLVMTPEDLPSGVFSSDRVPGRLALSLALGVSRMLVRYSQISQASGSAGGLTAAKNLGGNYLRKRIKPLNPRSSAQSRARSQLAAASAAWDLLTPTQRTAWNDAAKTKTVSNKLGEETKLSGQQWFCKINAFRYLNGQATVTTPPSLSAPAMTFDEGSLSLDATTPELNVDVADPSAWRSNNNGRLAIFLSPGQSAGVTSPAGGFTYWATINGNTTTPVTAVNVDGSAITPPHSIIAGKVYFVRFRSADQNGNVSLDVIYRVVAA